MLNSSEYLIIRNEGIPLKLVFAEKLRSVSYRCVSESDSSHYAIFRVSAFLFGSHSIDNLVDVVRV